MAFLMLSLLVDMVWMRFQWMMHIVWLQVVSRDWLNYCGAKGDGPFCRGIAETSRIARGTSGIEDKAVATKAQTWKVRQWLTRSWVCAEKKDLKRSRDWRVTRLGVAQTICCCSLNNGKLELKKGFFPGKTCNLMLVRGTISFYNQRLQICILLSSRCKSDPNVYLQQNYVNL